MGIIKVQDLSKDYLIYERNKGFTGALKDLIHRKYYIKQAVKDVTFDIEEGEIVGYIGPNGAGKSTTIKMLAGILVPTSGIIEVNGLIPFKSRIENAKKIGVVFGQRTQLWWDIPLYESLKLMKYMYKIPESQFVENINTFSEILEIDKFMHTPVRQLSLGQRMRGDLCAALLHNPDILFLDEPTIGLDIVAKEKIRQFIKEINKSRKTTVILTTHDVSDIEKLCSRVIVIDQGKVLYDGNLGNLKNLVSNEEILNMEFNGEIDDIENIYELGLNGVVIKGNNAIVKYDKSKLNSSKVIGWFMQRSNIVDLSVKEIELEEVIRKLYTNSEIHKVN